MTPRKPPGVSFETFVERQIREAQARGEFDNLPGMGKPLPGLDQPYDEYWWVKAKLKRENLSFLPPSLALRKEAEDVLATAAKARSEREVRALISDLNAKIAAAIRQPMTPPVDLVPIDVEEVVARWRDHR